MLCAHPDVDELHVTGSVATHARMKQLAPGKRITAELGNVTPVIVVPGRWSTAELAYHAENVAAMLTNNAGFNCATARMLITARAWPQREAFLDAVRHRLRRVSPKPAWYPHAEQAYERFIGEHPGAEQLQPSRRTGRVGGHVAPRLSWGSLPASTRMIPTSPRSGTSRSVASSARRHSMPPTTHTSCRAPSSSPTSGCGARSTRRCWSIRAFGATRGCVVP
jgi:hypothetical protein